MKNFYAVKKGYKTGIFTDWNEVSDYVKGYMGAQFHGFNTYKEAEDYLNGIPSPKNEPGISLEYPYAYVDGSYNAVTGVYGCGGLLSTGSEKYKIQRSGSDPEIAALRNVAGELLGAMEAVRIAKGIGLNSLVIYYDYSGIEAWATGAWQARKRPTQLYASYMREKMCEGFKIEFRKVKAHSGVIRNEIADKLAKEAVGLSA